MTDSAAAPHLQPLLDDATVVLRAPTQVWSGRGGDLGSGAIDGIYHGDVRFIRHLEVTYDDLLPEWISTSPDGPSRVVFGGLLRAVDDRFPDPKVRLLRDRTVSDGEVTEKLSVVSGVGFAVRTMLRVRLGAEFAPMPEVKAGAPIGRAVDASTAVDGGVAVARLHSEGLSVTVTAPGARLHADGAEVVLEWDVEVAAGEQAEVVFRMALDDPDLIVRGVQRPTGWKVRRDGVDFRLSRWLDRALGDLDALRLSLPGHPEDEFFAAGAPWFFTLFGRDSLWAARLALPIDWRPAASTLRVLARLQGDSAEADTAEQPGKILHELRGSPFDIPAEGIVLPPVYYGTVDATALWVCLLSDAFAWGMPDAEVRALLPALRAALDWIVEHGDSDGDGFIDYIDTTGHGLANQGWKDSGDSIQWRDGTLAEGPIALCEVQGYAYEAVVAGAALLERFGEGGADELHTWAARLKARFAESYWVETPEGRYPAVALDAHKRPVDTLTSNIGHLLGTGILDPNEEADVARLLTGPTMLSGYGVRTMSTQATGYWPLSYHGGSVWTHDTAIIAHGLARAGLQAEAQLVIENLLATAEGFEYRVPELHSGDPSTEASRPTPYPAACRPQAWAAAAAIAVLQISLGLEPDAPASDVGGARMLVRH